jgi:hypothetical protein
MRCTTCHCAAIRMTIAGTGPQWPARPHLVLHDERKRSLQLLVVYSALLSSSLF